jgi:hypothetical protein
MGIERDKFNYEAEHLNMASIAPENGNHKLGNAPWWFKLQLVAAVLCVIGIVIGFAGVLIPFEPYKAYGWEDIPKELCPGDHLRPSSVSEVVAGPYTVGKGEGFAGIVNTNGVPVDTWAIDTELDPHPRQVQPSRVIRVAPEERGHYKLSFDVDVKGRMFGLVPRYQEVEKTSDKTFFVRSESDSRCRND